MGRPSRLPLYAGVVLVACGWAALGLGWWQAGRQELETGQIPYVISGGFGGFGLLLMGGIAVLIDIVRQSEWKLRRSAEDLHQRMEELAETFVAGRARVTGTGSSKRPVRRPRRRPTASTPQRHT